jgi:hypothetical protein
MRKYLIGFASQLPVRQLTVNACNRIYCNSSQLPVRQLT